MDKNNIFVLMKSGLIAVVFLIFAYPSFSQVNNEQLTTTVIDTVNDQEDLFDDNTNYKELYKDLNKDGDWVQMKESDLDDDSDDPESVRTEVTNVRIINVWKPRSMGTDWSPYSEGRWVYTYSGWVWSSDYDWGWAAYHYGRWIFDEMWGWVWMPGRYWAPSWVQWCYNPSYIGWYPIYPRRHGWHHRNYGWHDRYYHGGHHNNWVIVKRNQFTEKINKDVIVDRNKNKEIINGSKTKAIIKNNGGSLENVGPKVTAIEKNTGQKIQPKEINYNGSKGITKIDNNSVTVYRNDMSKKDKINSQNGSRTKEVNNGSRTKGDNTVTKTKGNNGSRTKGDNGTKSKDSNNGSKSNNNNNYRNKDSNNNRGSNPNRESSRNRESNSNRNNNSNRGGNSNHESSRGNNGSKGNNGSRGNDSSRGNNDSKSR